jgi:putative IMPACT (imprinted ancient) family translation regulator
LSDPTEKLNRVYICLVDCYLQLAHIGCEDAAQQIVTIVEKRLEQTLEAPSTFQLLSELGNILRKHDHLQISVQLYKKSLLSLKQRFKNNYLQKRDTSRVLINIASTEYMR